MDMRVESSHAHEVRIAYGSERNQFGDLRLPHGSGPHPVVLVIHGGFWREKYDLEHIAPFAAAVTALGLASWSIEYRRIGEPGGGWPGTFLDVASAASHLRTLEREYSLDLGRVIAMGHSAGGHLALWLGASRNVPSGSEISVVDPLPLRGAVALAGVSDLIMCWEEQLSRGVAAELLGGSPADIPERYVAASPIELLPTGVPQFVIHGTSDDTVPVEMSRRYAERAYDLGDAVRPVILPGTGHYELIDPASEAWPEVARAIHSLLEG